MLLYALVSRGVLAGFKILGRQSGKAGHVFCGVYGIVGTTCSSPAAKRVGQMNNSGWLPSLSELVREKTDWRRRSTQRGTQNRQRAFLLLEKGERQLAVGFVVCSSATFWPRQRRPSLLLVLWRPFGASGPQRVKGCIYILPVRLRSHCSCSVTIFYVFTQFEMFPLTTVNMRLSSKSKWSGSKRLIKWHMFSMPILIFDC